jgi:hypothetical protein
MCGVGANEEDWVTGVADLVGIGAQKIKKPSMLMPSGCSHVPTYMSAIGGLLRRCIHSYLFVCVCGW